MFEHLDNYSVVLVTGPQRSGTTIAARMIAHDTDLSYIDEQAFKATDVEKWRDIVERSLNVVIQCPGMCRWVHEYGDRDNVAVVMVCRPVEDIIASQRRIGWRYEAYELRSYEANGARPVARVKYDYWYEHQKGVILNAYELQYESLSNHPLWVPKERRRFFGPRQWRE